jgi:group I intron endonuclease
MLGRTHTAETKAAISDALKGKAHSEEHKAAISAAMSTALMGNTNRVGSTHSEATKAAISAALSKSVYVYDSQNVLVGSFTSHKAAAAFLGISKVHVGHLVKRGGRTQKGFLITSTPLT